MAAVLALYPQWSWGQEGSVTDLEKAEMAIEEEFDWLQEEGDVTFVITASRVKEDIRRSASSITVITDEQIRKMGARHLMDVIKTVPGMSYRYRSDGHYKFDTRGISKNGGQDILLMVNSHPLNENYTGGGTWTHDTMIVDNIKRIEVIRGPGSAMYGANAFSGVVNIITKDAKDIDGVQATAGAGSDDTQQYNLLMGKVFNEFEVAFNFNYMTTDGYGPYIEKDAQTGYDAYFGSLIPGYQPASNAPGEGGGGDEKYDVALNLKFKGFTLDGKYVDRKRTPILNALSSIEENNEDTFTDYYINLKYERRVLDNLSLYGKIYYNYNEYAPRVETPENAAFFKPDPSSPIGLSPFLFEDGILAEFSIENRRTGGEIQMTYDFSESNTLVAGFTYENMEQFDVEYSANFLYTPYSGVLIPLPQMTNLTGDDMLITEADREFMAFFFQDLWDLRDNLRLTLGARYDDYSDFGNSFNPRAGIVWEYIPNYDLKVLYGRAFRAPTFQELYMQNNPSQVGNKDLDPEVVDTYEVSTGAQIKSFKGRITGFYSTIKDSIINVQNAEGLYVFQNADELESKGFELEMSYNFSDKTYIGMNYTYQHAVNTDTDERLHLRPRQKGNVMANVELFDWLNWYAEYHFQYDFTRKAGDNRDDPEGFGIVNTTLIAKDFLKDYEGLELRASFYNLFDEDYSYPSSSASTIPGDLPMPGFSFFAEVRYSFW